MRLSIAAGVLGMGAVTLSASGAVLPPTPVALSGTAAPTGIFTSSFGTPTINASGRVAFTGSMIGGTSVNGLFTGTPGSVQAVALSGTASPGGGGNYDSFFSNFNMNASGQVAFVSSLTGGTSSQGVFTGTPGSVSVAALAGTAAPAGATYAAFGIPVSINASGQVGYLGTLSGGPTQGVYAGPAGAVANVARNGLASPAGGTFSGLTVPTINPAGKIVFGTAISGGSYAGGLFIGDGNGIQPVAPIGSAAPGGGAIGSTFGAMASVNAAEQVVFFSSLSSTSAAVGIFAGTAGSLAAVARQGDPTPAGGTFTNLGSVPVINAAGQVAFRSDLTGTTATRGIFLGTPGSLQTVALQGQPSPDGVGVFGTFATALTASFALNASGQIAFTSTFTGTGVTTANDVALVAGTPGNLSILVREGDVIDVDTGPGIDLRTVSAINFGMGSGGEDGRNVTLTDNGMLAYRLTFTDTTVGIFTSAVPEPASLGVLAAGVVMAMRRRRR